MNLKQNYVGEESLIERGHNYFLLPERGFIRRGTLRWSYTLKTFFAFRYNQNGP